MFTTLESYGNNDACFLEEGQVSTTSDSRYVRRVGQYNLDKESETNETK